MLQITNYEYFKCLQITNENSLKLQTAQTQHMNKADASGHGWSCLCLAYMCVFLAYGLCCFVCYVYVVC